ncbi:polyhydroxyalkanoate synthase [Pseudonocardia eucalypti]|uniref:PHA/PHB synthase family protein n=1 Tax=Pseudonocardia eucalypti TaxID=648755 RepID=UPI00185E41FA|nr:polyhydroxyalkanoate synthase [Pseudonocardia eucalypti]
MTVSEDPPAPPAPSADELVEELKDFVAGLDPMGFGPALVSAASSLAGRPFPLARATVSYWGGAGQAVFASAMRAVGVEVDGPAEAPGSDRRYSDRAYRDNAWFYLSRQQHALFADYLRQLAAEADLDPTSQRKLEFAVDQVVEALAPTNFPLTNPAVLKRAFDTGGHSLLRGAQNLLRDVLTNNGEPRQVTPGRFQVGRDLAVTPGKVVYRNRLIELIQYAPATETVHRVPMLFSPPWINKYYILDLAPGKSLVEWAVRHGHTCFAISYRNPDGGLRDVGMSDYLREGPLAALEVIRDITGAPEANIVALCLGGTLATATAAWLSARGEPGVSTLTLMNTLLDFTEPGALGVFTDADTVRNLERMMRRPGYLPASRMKATFDALRPADLVWNYVVNNWLMGDEPAAFDLLAWNGDSTRMPAAMQLEYLRTCYVDNQLATGKMVLGGERLDLGAVHRDAYVITAEADHIAPWRTVYGGARLLGGEVRFVLSNSGHIAGVVNPPSARSRHWYADVDRLPERPEEWHGRAERRAGSWWEDWTPWIAGRAGEMVAPPPMGSPTHPPLLDAPGSYVHN